MKKIITLSIFTLFLANTSIAQGFGFNITPSVQCFGAGTNSAVGSVTAPAGGATSYTWIGFSSGGASCTPVFSMAVPNNSITNIFYPCCGVYTIICSAFSNSLPVGSTTKTVAIACGGGTTAISASPSTTLCTGASVTLSVPGASTYSWSTQATTSVIVVSPSVTTAYSVTAQTSTCAPSVGNVTITVSPTPTILINNPNNIICTGQSATLTASGASQYIWSNFTTGSVVVVTPTATTVYSVGGSANGCFSGASFTQSVVICTGLRSLAEGASGANVFPNPSHAVFHIQTGTTEKTRIELCNSLGSLLFSQDVTGGTYQLNLENYARGIYYLRIHRETPVVLKMVRE